MSKVLLYDCMRGSINVCLLNTGIDPHDKNSKSCQSVLCAGLSSLNITVNGCSLLLVCVFNRKMNC